MTQPGPNSSLALSTIQNIESSFQFKVFVLIPNFRRVTGSHKDFLSHPNRLQKRFSFAYFSNIIMVSGPQIGLNDKLKFYGVDPSSATAQKHRHKDVGKSFPLSSVITATEKSFERFGKGRGWRKFCYRRECHVEKGNYLSNAAGWSLLKFCLSTDDIIIILW